MASLSQDRGRKGFRLSFYGLDKRKRSMWLGGFSRRQATTVKTNVEHLLVSRAAGDTPDVHVARWLGSIGPELRKKLITAELIEPTADDHGPATLGPFLNQYIASRKDVKPETLATYRQGVRSLIDYFGADRRLDSNTAGDAELWRVWQATEGNQRETERSEIAESTVRRRTGLARQFFTHAIKRKLISENPFDGLPATVRGNAKRQQFIPQETIYRVLKLATCPELRAVIALSRFAGIRIPSEAVALTWQDIDLEAGRLTIRASKTEHHEDGGIRFCPIFPELRPYLVALYDRTNPGIDCPLSAPVFRRWRSADQNIRTPFLKLLRQAGVEAWPKLFHNMRASRETELLAEFPVKDVCSWIGNSQAVAMEHYAMTTADSFQRAICGSTGGSIRANQEISEDDTQNEKPSETRVSEGSCDPVMSGPMGDTGFEPVTSTV